MTLSLPVSEMPFTTLQGEGPHAGRRVQFLRLGGCNLSCSWCDTPYTWDGQRFDLRAELTMTSVADIVAAATPRVPLVISGGEPLLHQSHLPVWEPLLESLGSLCGEVHIETNGTLAPNEVTAQWVTHASVSPKLANAGVHRGNQSPELHPDWAPLAQEGRLAIYRSAILKFVVRGPADVDEAVAYADRVQWPRDRVWVMPEGTTVEELTARWPVVAKAALDHGINASHRLHVLAFGDTRGT